MVDGDITDDEQSTAQKKYVTCLQCKFVFNIQVTATCIILRNPRDHPSVVWGFVTVYSRASFLPIQ